MEASSELLLADLHPALVSKFRMLAAAFLQTYPTDILELKQGLRTWAKQAAIYAQGRTTPGKIVTQAPPGHSWHEFGLAGDVCPLSLVATPNWSPESPLWPWLSDKGQDIGLYPGACFHLHPDLPHFQLTGNLPVSPDDEVRQLFKDGGIAAVWEATGLTMPPVPT